MDIPQTVEDRFEDGMIKSLCYLHQEAIKKNLADVANVISHAIDAMRDKVNNRDLSHESQGWLQQFYLLRGFQSLSLEQKQGFLREIELAEKYKVN